MEIIGHTKIIKRLKKLISADTLPHALLFTGPQSVGKRRVADWLAKQITPKNPERIFVLSEDELLIDAVRLLKRIASLSAPKKASNVIILDGVASLSTEAANALLKTLEEPRGAVHFILIVHGDGTDLLPTIKSRSSIFRFAPVPAKTISRELQKQLSLSEKKAIDIARRSFGSPGKAIMLHTEGDSKESGLQERFVETIDSPLVDRFTLIKEVVDDEESLLFLTQGILFLRDVLLFQEGCNDLLLHKNLSATEGTARSLANERLRSVLETMLSLESAIITSNVNRRLALEEAVLTL